MSTLDNLTERRIRDLERQLVERTEERDRARDVAAVEEERNEAALRLHSINTKLSEFICNGCGAMHPCATRRALTGADEL